MASMTQRRFTDVFKREAVASWKASGRLQTEGAAELGSCRRCCVVGSTGTVYRWPSGTSRPNKPNSVWPPNPADAPNRG